LLHNTLGAWHAGKVLAARPELAQSASSEAELRAAVALPGYAFDYLRFVRDAEGQPWRPAAGTFAGWPKTARDLRLLDPCCGSGHFLVASFELLVALRQHEEGLDTASAATAVLRDNLCGLELDARCTQIAVFALAMAAWRRCGSVVELPPLQVACCGLGPSGSKEQWLKLAEQAAAHGGMPVKRGLFSKEESLLSAPIRNALEDLYLLFQKAPELGSLIDPKATAAGLFQAGRRDVLPLLERVLRSESAGEEAQEQAVAAQGMAKAAAILGQEFTLVVTNVPYLGRGSQGDVLKEFVEQHYPDAKADLATVFVQRAFGWLGKCGTMAVVTPQNWLFLTSYRKLREKLLKERTWNVVVRMGEHAFESTAAAGAFAGMVFLSAGAPQIDHVMSGVDVSAPRGQRPIYADEKAALLRGEILAAASDGEPGSVGAGDGEDAAGSEGEADGGANGPADGSVKLVPQAEQLKNPDARIVLMAHQAGELLANRASAFQGVKTGDDERFTRCFWEIDRARKPWQMFQTTVKTTVPWGGNCFRIDETEELWARSQGKGAWGRVGVAVSQMSTLPVALYSSERFDSNMSPIVLEDAKDITALWSFCSSPEFAKAVRRIDQALKVTNASLVKVPFDLAHWQRVAAERYPHGLPEPQTNDPTQWLFHGHPAGMLAAGREDASPFGIPDPTIHAHPSLLCRTPNAAAVLQVATARLLGYRWPAELDGGMRLDAVQRAWATRS
ncbi:MAG: Eco57I restriction-modification methylase domain-containing protein, partial [Phycisphaerae bacterium]